MGASILVSDHEAAIRGFIAAEAAPLSPATTARYERVVEALFEFLEVVDVRHRFGPEIARHLAVERDRRGEGAFLPALGFASLLRVLPEFLDDPWLPPQGAQRASHRVVVERLLLFLRRRELVDSAVLRHEFSRVRKAIGTARARDFGWRVVVEEPAAAEEVLQVTVGLSSAVLDRLLAEVERDHHTSLAEVIEAQLQPGGWGRDTFDGW